MNQFTMSISVRAYPALDGGDVVEQSPGVVEQFQASGRRKDAFIATNKQRSLQAIFKL
ncbi:hypothetical protein L1889_14025 [Paenalcaligenes niemegkensis]|uniref:hypothetical protein n=1 Tax=Paenalcaligenes niemegkensis TaxID=2895469 RepID=UPI001EE8A3D1|nr:hypothetical protein [Paenalcaligenes niemegkensis]MCQ9617658.1 hypothetical protein [Paenalcaligenes niemegkensis]